MKTRHKIAIVLAVTVLFTGLLALAIWQNWTSFGNIVLMLILPNAIVGIIMLLNRDESAEEKESEDAPRHY